MNEESALGSRLLRPLLDDSISQIESGVRDFLGGDLAAYRRVAAELYNLLVDTNPRSGPLLMRVLPDARLHGFREPLNPVPRGEREFVVVAMDARGGSISHRDGPTAIVVAVLPTDGPLVTVEEWLDDWFMQPSIVLRELIREVRNKDAGHTDPDEGLTMEALRKWRASTGGREIEMKRAVIVGIGEYVAARIRTLLMEADGLDRRTASAADR